MYRWCTDHHHLFSNAQNHKSQPSLINITSNTSTSITHNSTSTSTPTTIQSHAPSIHSKSKQPVTMQPLFRCPLLLLLPPSTLGMKDVTIKSFGNPPSHTWISINDPVMGGQSTATFTIDKITKVGIFAGEVKDVPSLQAPGFISARTPRTGSLFPDLTTCDGLKLRLRSTTPYDGYRISFGTNFAGTMQYAHKYEAHFDVPSSDSSFHDVLLKFTDFSDN